MKAEAQQRSPTEYSVKVEIPQEVVGQKLEALYRRVAQQIELPGFRRGRVPRSFLEARFGKDFLYEDAQHELMSEYLPEALQQLKLTPASMPKTTVIEFERGKPFKFEASFEVLPQIDVKDYLGVELEDIPPKNVDQKEIEAALESLRFRHGTLVPKSGLLAEAGDVATLLRVARQEEVQLRLDPKEKLGGKLIGKRVGDEIEIEGERLKLMSLKRIELPDDGELAKVLGYESVEQLHSGLKAELEKSAQQEREQQLKEGLLDAILEKNRVPVPQRMVEEILILEAEALKRQGIDLSDEQIASHKKRIERSLGRDLILDAIKKKENIRLSDEEFSEFLKQEAQKQGMNPLKFRALLEQQRRLDSFREDLERKRALDFIFERAVIKR